MFVEIDGVGPVGVPRAYESRPSGTRRRISNGSTSQTSPLPRLEGRGVATEDGRCDA